MPKKEIITLEIITHSKIKLKPENPIEVICELINYDIYRYSNEYYQIHSTHHNKKVALQNFKANFIIGWQIYTKRDFSHMMSSVGYLVERFGNVKLIS